MMGLEDPYTAYCFNEACAYVMYRLDSGDKIVKKNRVEVKPYRSFSDYYKQFK